MPALRSPIRSPFKRVLRSPFERGTSAAAPALPAGAIGVWYADQYQATPRKVIPNAANAIPVSQNLLTAPRRLFSVSEIWGAAGGITITDDAAVASDGSNEASTLVMSAGASLGITRSATLPAGTYTIICGLKRNTGSDQEIAFTIDNTATLTSPQTVTSSWQRKFHSFISASPLTLSSIRLCTKDGVTAANVQIESFEIVSGAVDPGATALAGHLYLGASQYDTATTCAGGELDVSVANSFGLIQFASAQSITTGFTAIVCAKKTAAGTGYHSFLSSVKAYTAFSAATEINGVPAAFVSGATINNFAQSASDLWKLLGAGYHVFTLRADGTEVSLWVDDVKLFAATTAFTTFSLSDLYVGLTATISLNSGLLINSEALYARALTDVEVRTAASVLATRLGLSGKAIGGVDFIVYEGDSITGGFTYSYPYVSTFSRTNAVLGNNLAVSGSTLASISARVSRVNEIVPPNKNGRKFIFSVLDGANDLVSLSATPYLANLDTYLNTSITASFDGKIVGTITPTNSAPFNTQRNIANPVLLTWPGLGKCSANADFAGNATIGTDAAGSDTGKYSDGLHPSAATQITMRDIHVAVVNSL